VNPDGFCMLIIIITSIYVVLLIEAILLFIILEFFGVTLQSILDSLVAQICGP